MYDTHVKTLHATKTWQWSPDKRHGQWDGNLKRDMVAPKMAYVYVWNDGLRLTVIEIYLIVLIIICFAVKKNTIQYNTIQF